MLYKPLQSMLVVLFQIMVQMVRLVVVELVMVMVEQVELAVYNEVGQQVAILAQGVRDPGTYAVAWDGKAEHGGKLASGLYLYQLQAGARVETRKLLLLR